MSDRPQGRYGPDPGAFRAAFEVGASDDEIHPVDGLGVALASLKGLHELVTQHAGEVDQLRRRLDALEHSPPDR